MVPKLLPRPQILVKLHEYFTEGFRMNGLLSKRKFCIKFYECEWNHPIRNSELKESGGYFCFILPVLHVSVICCYANFLWLRMFAMQMVKLGFKNWVNTLVFSQEAEKANEKTPKIFIVVIW